MTFQPLDPIAGAEAGRQIAQLLQVQALIGEIAGEAAPAEEDVLDHVARIGAAYDGARPIVRRRFDALAGETSAWAAAGVEAIVAKDGPQPRAAARRLFEELNLAQVRLGRMLGL